MDESRKRNAELVGRSVSDRMCLARQDPDGNVSGPAPGRSLKVPAALNTHAGPQLSEDLA